MGLLDKIKGKLDKDKGTAGGSSASGGGVATQSATPPLPLEQSVARYRRQRGINLGSWFVTEEWLATKLYAAVAVDPKGSDFDLARGKNAKAAMEQHWDTWMTDDDWTWIRDRGFNSVRLPIGYYHLASPCPEALKGTDFEKYADVYTGAWDRILRAVEKAGQYGLGVLVDFHAAPGAQNADGHSGMSGGKVEFWKRSNLDRTSVTLRFLASTFASNPNVVGLELLNEPKNDNHLQKWYETTLNELRGIAGNDFPMYVSDAWDTAHYAGWVGGRSDFVVLDHHLYRCFDASDRALSGSQNAEKLKAEFAPQLSEWCKQANGALVVAEWSGGLDQSCLPPNTTDEQKDADKRAWVGAQLDLFTCDTAGYWFWTLKTDRDWDAGWSARNAAQAEILPHSLIRRRFSQPQGGAQEQACKQATDAHVGYWSQNGGQPNAEAYSSGFIQGWNDALMFLSSPGVDELGFVIQWARRRRGEYESQRRPLGDQAWQYEHGLKQGVDAASAASE